MTTNTNTIPSIRELTAQAFKDGCSQTKDACEYVRARIERFNHEELVNAQWYEARERHAGAAASHPRREPRATLP